MDKMKLIMKWTTIMAIGLTIFSFSFCESGNQNKIENHNREDSLEVEFLGNECKHELRDPAIIRMKSKIQSKKPLVVHAFVPLCDNENQGIVPVNKQLGDGLNLKTNLYWGAGYGVKSYFKKYDGWKLLHSEQDSVGNVLERVIFYKKNTNGTEIYLVADGYRGDRMKECLHDYFRSLGGWKKGNDSVQNKSLPIYGDADLLVFNGHDGLMDDTLKEYFSKDSVIREAVSISCYSKSYFHSLFAKCGAYPLVCTSGLLAPEAYVLGAVIDQWSNQKSALEIRNAAGDAYHSKHPSTSQKGARALFTTGW
jgi:hypothetical protein